jgi:hypothetical protein
MFLVFTSGTELYLNSPIFAFSILLFVLFQFLYLFFREDSFGVSNVFMVVFSDGHGELPPLLHR